MIVDRSIHYPHAFIDILMDSFNKINIKLR